MNVTLKGLLLSLVKVIIFNRLFVAISMCIENFKFCKLAIVFFFAADSTKFAECAIGDVKFINFTDDVEEGSRQGVLQICINNAWGAICSDNYFGNTDAEVFCNLLVGFNSSG